MLVACSIVTLSFQSIELSVLGPLGWNPLRLSLQEIDLIKQLLKDIIHVIKRNHGIEILPILLLHILGKRDRVSIFLLLEKAKELKPSSYMMKVAKWGIIYWPSLRFSANGNPRLSHLDRLAIFETLLSISLKAGWGEKDDVRFEIRVMKDLKAARLKVEHTDLARVDDRSHSVQGCAVILLIKLAVFHKALAAHVLFELSSTDKIIVLTIDFALAFGSGSVWNGRKRVFGVRPTAWTFDWYSKNSRGTAAANRLTSSRSLNRNSCRPIFGGPTRINGRL